MCLSKLRAALPRVILRRAEGLDMRWLMVVAALALAGPAEAVEDVDGSFAKLPAAQQAAIKDVLDRVMSDGPSSRIRELRIPNKQYDPESVCFLLNSKNKMGAYTGYQSVLFDLGTREIYLARDLAGNEELAFRKRAHDRICTS